MTWIIKYCVPGISLLDNYGTFLASGEAEEIIASNYLPCLPAPFPTPDCGADGGTVWDQPSFFPLLHPLGVFPCFSNPFGMLPFLEIPGGIVAEVCVGAIASDTLAASVFAVSFPSSFAAKAGEQTSVNVAIPNTNLVIRFMVFSLSSL